MAAFPQIEDLPRRNATEVKNKWSDLVREVRARGSVAVTHHNKVEMVVVEAARYQEMAALADGVSGQREVVLAELAAEFDERLAALQAPGTRRRFAEAMASRGRVKPRPKAGRSF